jgi:hypothetical protein
MGDWSEIIAAMRVQSGEPVEKRMSDEVVALLDERFGVEVAEADRVVTTQLPRVAFEAGLSDSEVEAVQDRFGFHFPPDLRAFLQTALPVGERFPNWRSGNVTSLRKWLDLPLAGVCFDVEHNAFWLQDWGPRPASLDEALSICQALVANAPRLIPIYSHRFMPDEPRDAGNPVFSVHRIPSAIVP